MRQKYKMAVIRDLFVLKWKQILRQKGILANVIYAYSSVTSSNL